MTLLSWTVRECGAETCQQGECSYTNVWPTTLMEQDIEKILLFVCMVSDFVLSCILNYDSYNYPVIKFNGSLPFGTVMDTKP